MPLEPTHTVLVVDDDSAVRRVLRIALEWADFRVIESSDGAAALAVLDDDSQRVSAVVSDIGMPRMDGLEFIERLPDRADDLPVILTSGQHGPGVLPDVVRRRIDAFVAKPYSLDAIISTVSEAVARRRGADRRAVGGSGR